MKRRVLALLALPLVVTLPLVVNFCNLFPAQLTDVAFTTCEHVSDKDSAERRLKEVVQPGDIILVRGSGVEDLLVGVRYSPYWTHAMIYVGWGMVVEGTVRGVVCSPLQYVLECEEFCVLRVNAPINVRLAAALFALNQVGKPCNWNCFQKRIYGDSYYCSEIVWAAYKASVTVAGVPCGPDVDGVPFWSPLTDFGVSPAEIFLAPNTHVILLYSSRQE
ncbi:MAG: YiiX/YebB-like N1pC/P60 family cysteine hydrolase [Candidatus Jordarchaeales archaeon]